MASIRKRAQGVYQVRVSTGRRDAEGRYVYETRTVHGDRRDASDEALKLEQSHGSRRFLGGDPTLDELLTRWFAHLEARDRSPNTMRGYRHKTDVYLPKTLRARRLSRLTAGDLDQLYDDLTRRELAPATVRQLHAIIRAALHQAERWGLVGRNVASLASPPTVGQREQHPPSATDVRRIIGWAAATGEKGSSDFACWLYLAAATGARRAELCALRWDDLDPKVGTLAIRRSVAYVGNEAVPLPTKTRSTRVVHLDKATLAVLAEHRARGLQRATKRGHDLHEWMFASDEGAPWRPDRVTRAWSRLRELHPSIGATRIHDVRHFAATQLLDAGVPLPTVAARLGHADGITTMRTYAHQTQPADVDAGEVLGMALSGKTKRPRR